MTTEVIRQEMVEVHQLEHFHLTPQLEIIMFYIIRHQPITANQIASYLNVSKSAISQVLSKLEEQSLIIRKKKPENRREAFIHLGERGQEYGSLLEKIDKLLVQNYYSKVSLEELQYVLKVLTKLVHSSEG